MLWCAVNAHPTGRVCVPWGPDLWAEFWASAQVRGPRLTRSVHLKLDRLVFAYFVAETGGKGHLTRMQAAYVEAMKAG